ncbi:MAG TPA: hypothetical protein VG096_10955 [Bryobacteraceae bacterium]|nr:hypothetical protein [Bryobacteraceae bacterium]
MQRLAGCIAIELLLGFLTAAADFDYRAGAASYGLARVLVIEDRHHHRAVLLNVAFSTPLPVSDRIGALAAKAHGLDRSALVIHSTIEGEPAPFDAVTAISTALSGLESARVSYGDGKLAVSTAAACTVVLHDAAMEDCTATPANPVRGPIRSAFRVVDLARGLQVRAAAPRYATVQAIALGGAVVILSAPANLVEPAPDRIVAALAAIDPDARVAAALGDVLARVRKKR